MDANLKEELDYTLELLVKSAFFNEEDIIEILEDQFIDEGIDFSKIDFKLIKASNSNFSLLEQNFIELAKKDIIAIHNCGYDIEEGVADAFELAIHLRNNGENPIGFCFYTFEDIEEAIHDSKLALTFGDFESDKDKALQVGKTIVETLDFDINWNESINEQISIDPFIWDKSYDDSKDFEIEGAYEAYMKIHKECENE